MLKFQRNGTQRPCVFSVSRWCLVTLEPAPTAQYRQNPPPTPQKIRDENGRARLYCRRQHHLLGLDWSKEKRGGGEQSEGQVATAARKRCGNRWHPPLTIERHCARTTELEGLLDAAAFHYTAGKTSSR